MENSRFMSITDLEALLKPISAEAPTGQDLRFVWFDPKKGIAWPDRIREAHRENLYETIPKLPDWPTVIELCTQALTSLSKDLQIAAWLSEALVKYDRSDRLEGLHQSVQLLRGLIERYWEGLFPPGDPEDDSERFTTRVNIMTAFDTRLSAAIKTIPLTESATGQKYSLLDWEDSRVFDVPDKGELDSLASSELEKVNQLKEKAEAQKKITSENWRKAVGETPYQFFKERLDLAAKCAEELTALDEAMDLKFQREAPGVKELRRSLEDLTSLLRQLERENRPPELAAAGDGSILPGEEDTPGGGLGVVAVPSSVQTRQEAFRHLARVAEYFQRTEPQSPVPYLLHRAIQWGQMPLEVWLPEIVKDAGVLSHLHEVLGIKHNGE